MNALSPAKVSRVSILDEEQRIMEVVVEDKQLSLAIGKKGQNVRLAAKIVGWRIDIKSEEEKRQEVEAEMARMARIVEELRSLEAHGVGDKVVQKLIDAGVGGPRPPPRDDRRGAVPRSRASGPRRRRRSARPPTAAKVEWDARDAEEAARVEAERVAAERPRGRAGGGGRGRLAEAAAAAEAAGGGGATAASRRRRRRAGRGAGGRERGAGGRGGRGVGRGRGAGWGTLGSSSSRGI